MSKSLGNSLLVTEVVKRVRPIELRWYLASAHYRSNLEFSDAALSESAVAFSRIENFVRRATELVGNIELAADITPAFANAMNDDLNVPAALAVLQNCVTEGNTALASNDSGAVKSALVEVRGMLDVLGVDPLGSTWSTGASDDSLIEIADALIQARIAARTAAKAEKDFATADAIRDELKNIGVVLEDGADGVRWNVER
jgi:cysteinyl-tRNA synthetase